MFEKSKSYSEIALEKADFIRWLNAANDVPDQGRRRALKMMGMALREELTEKQLKYISAYHIEQLTMNEIGTRYGVNRSTVSRTIKRAQSKVKKVLRYCSPILLNDSFSGNVEAGYMRE